jgi:2-(1,2-epoxy-1,2-dihydrophenyl)acetyl-CoA isomerase
MSYETLLVERDGTLLDVTLNRPDKLNAMNLAMFDELPLLADEAAADEAVRAVFLHGAGRAFCSGADLSEADERADLTPLQFRRWLMGANSVVSKLYRLEKPVVTAIHGPAAGAGCNLALATDVRFVSEQGYFMQVFSKRGLVPDFGGLWLLPRLVGQARAKELFLSGRKVMGPEAVEIGLASRLCPQESVIEEARAFAKELSEGPTQCYAILKAGMNMAADASLEQILEYEAYAQSITRISEDTDEAVAAFLEKRTPRYTGR